jgi:hypothetical protein
MRAGQKAALIYTGHERLKLFFLSRRRGHAEIRRIGDFAAHVKFIL